MNLKINIYLFLILFTNLINSNNIQNNPNILVEYTEENKKQIKINLINIEFIKNNEEGPSTERNEGNLVEIIIKINGILNEEDKLYLVQSALVKIRPVFYGVIGINIRDENGKDLNSKDVLQTIRPGSQHPHSTIKLNGIEAILMESIKNLGSAASPFTLSVYDLCSN
uniref:Uncharacterized protein n=1 Tax=Meloidogyne floridensis TaxID=298350 RepID=A0A915P4S1_9BILA